MLLPKLTETPDASWLRDQASTVTLSLPPGSLWDFAGFRAAGDAWQARPGVYRVLGVGRHVHTRQELIAHQGVGGPDDGLIYFCPLAAWARCFKPHGDAG